MRSVWPPSADAQRVLVAIGALALLLECFFYATVPEATGFETSLYAPYPFAHWVLFGVVLVTSIVVLVADAVERSNLWPYALGLSFANYGLFFFLPALRGYAFYGRGTTDALYHLAITKGLVELGRLPAMYGEVSWYPFIHVLSGELTLLGVPLELTGHVLSFAALLLVVLGSGVALYAFFQSRAALLLGFAAAHPLILTRVHISAQPHFISIALFPVIVACLEYYRRTRSRNILPVLVVLLVSVVTFHPVTYGLLVATLVVSAAFWQGFNWWQGSSRNGLHYWLAFMLVPLGFVWYIDFGTTASYLATIVTSLDGSSSVPLTEESQRAAETGLTTAQTALRFVQLYGGFALYLAIGGLVGLVVSWKVLRRRGQSGEAYLTAHAGFGFLVGVLFLTMNLIATGPLRIVRYLSLFLILLVGLALLWSVRSERRGSTASTLGLTYLIVGASVLTAGAVYIPNMHMTYAEYEGSQFALQTHGGNEEILAYDVDSKMELYLEGAGAEGSEQFWYASQSGNEVRPYLGYRGNDTAAQTYGEVYLTTKAHDRQQHTAAYFYPVQQRDLFMYDATQMAIITNDPTAQRYYDNGGFEAWRIRPANESTG